MAVKIPQYQHQHQPQHQIQHQHQQQEQQHRMQRSSSQAYQEVTYGAPAGKGRTIPQMGQEWGPQGLAGPKAKEVKGAFKGWLMQALRGCGARSTAPSPFPSTLGPLPSLGEEELHNPSRQANHPAVPIRTASHKDGGGAGIVRTYSQASSKEPSTPRGALGVLSRVAYKKCPCTFMLHVHGVEGLPDWTEGKELVIQWARRGRAISTSPALVYRGSVFFDQTLQLSCTLYCALGKAGVAHGDVDRIQPKTSTLSAWLLDAGTTPRGAPEEEISCQVLELSQFVSSILTADESEVPPRPPFVRSSSAVVRSTSAQPSGPLLPGNGAAGAAGGVLPSRPPLQRSATSTAATDTAAGVAAAKAAVGSGNVPKTYSATDTGSGAGAGTAGSNLSSIGVPQRSTGKASEAAPASASTSAEALAVVTSSYQTSRAGAGRTMGASMAGMGRSATEGAPARKALVQAKSGQQAGQGGVGGPGGAKLKEPRTVLIRLGPHAGGACLSVTVAFDLSVGMGKGGVAPPRPTQMFNGQGKRDPGHAIRTARPDHWAYRAAFSVPSSITMSPAGSPLRVGASASVTSRPAIARSAVAASASYDGSGPGAASAAAADAASRAVEAASQARAEAQMWAEAGKNEGMIGSLDEPGASRWEDRRPSLMWAASGAGDIVERRETASSISDDFELSAKLQHAAEATAAAAAEASAAAAAAAAAAAVAAAAMMGHAIDPSAALASSTAPLQLPPPSVSGPATLAQQTLATKEPQDASAPSDAAATLEPAAHPEGATQGGSNTQGEGSLGVHLAPINTAKAADVEREDDVRLSAEKGAWTAVTSASAASSDIVEVSENCAPGDSGIVHSQIQKSKPQRLQLEEGCTLSEKTQNVLLISPQGEEVEYTLVEGKPEEVNRGRSHEPGEFEDYPPADLLKSDEDDPEGRAIEAAFDAQNQKNAMALLGKDGEEEDVSAFFDPAEDPEPYMDWEAQGLGVVGPDGTAIDVAALEGYDWVDADGRLVDPVSLGLMGHLGVPGDPNGGIPGAMVDMNGVPMAMPGIGPGPGGNPWGGPEVGPTGAEEGYDDPVLAEWDREDAMEDVAGEFLTLLQKGIEAGVTSEEDLGAAVGAHDPVALAALVAQVQLHQQQQEEQQAAAKRGAKRGVHPGFNGALEVIPEENMDDSEAAAAERRARGAQAQAQAQAVQGSTQEGGHGQEEVAERRSQGESGAVASEASAAGGVNKGEEGRGELSAWAAGEADGGSVEDVRASDDSVSFAGSEVLGETLAKVRIPDSEDSPESLLEFLTPRSKPEGALEGEKESSDEVQGEPTVQVQSVTSQ